MLELPLPGIAGRESAHLVDGLHQAGRSQRGQDLAAEFIGLDRLGIGLGRSFERLGVRHGIRIFSGAADDQRFEPLGAHDRTQPAAAGRPAGMPIHIRGLNGGRAQLILSSRTDAGHTVLGAEFIRQFFHQGIRPHFPVSLALDQCCLTVRIDLEQPGFTFGRLALHHNGRNTEITQRRRHGAPDVALLDPAGQGTLGANREPAGIHQRGCAKIAGRKYQDVFGPQCITGCWHVIVDVTRRQGPSAQSLVRCRKIFDANRFRRHIDFDHFHHGLLSRALPGGFPRGGRCLYRDPAERSSSLTGVQS